MVQSLLLVGVVHHDPDGFKKALGFFQWYEPDLIMVELSSFGCKFRKKHGRQIRKTLQKNLKTAARRCNITASLARRHPAVRNILLQLALPFEYRAALSYARRSTAEVILVDSSNFSRYWIGFWPELVSVENLQKLLAEAHAPRSIQGLYRLAENSLLVRQNSHPAWALTGQVPAKDLWATREHYMAQRINDMTIKFRPQKPVYIGGWWHLSRDGSIPTLREILHLKSCQCCLLSKAKQHNLPKT